MLATVSCVQKFSIRLSLYCQGALPEGQVVLSSLASYSRRITTAHTRKRIVQLRAGLKEATVYLQFE
jgi:hypothetical protein